MIKFIKEGSKIICQPQFSIIASNAMEMRNQLLLQIENDDAWSELILDCDKVEVVDSIGINLIVGLYKKSEDESKKFMVKNCNEPLYKVLKLFRLDEQFILESK